jgi:hypothetical protein
VEEHLNSGRIRFRYEKRLKIGKHQEGITVFEGGMMRKQGNNPQVLSPLVFLFNVSVHGNYGKEKFIWMLEGGSIIYDLDNCTFRCKGTMIEIRNGYRDEFVTVLRSYNLFDTLPKTVE